jgi:hypothetical protein
MSNINNIEAAKYHATYERPQIPDVEVMKRIGRLSPMAKCLDQVLEELSQEQNESLDHQSMISEKDDTMVRSENIQLTQQFRDDVLDKFGTATFEAFYKRKNDKFITSDGHDTNTTLTGPPNRHRNKSQDEPPAALLHGKLKYYNRFGGQWRIVVSDAEIRSRVNVDYQSLKKNENRSLKEMHDIQMAKQSRFSNQYVTSDPLELLDQDGVLKINGDLVILACDDI